MSSNQTNKEHLQVLKIRKGTELYVHSSRNISDPSSYMNQSYRQAVRALISIVRQSKDFHKTINQANQFCCRNKDSEVISNNNLEEKLFSYSSNIIGFSGERGFGKTRMMLSFAEILKEGFGNQYSSQRCEKRDLLLGFSDKDRGVLEDVCFVVIPPISPSVLEKQKDILRVILTKLYDHTQEMMKRQHCHTSDRDERAYKLHKMFQECSSGIKGIKQSHEGDSGDLMELQDLREGLELRQHFYQLVQHILGYYGQQDVYLVLQLDDADSQIKNGFEVMEDVRKYLQIPNLIILMSADMDVMHDVIRQDHQRQFPDRKDDKAFQEKLTRVCRKYIDKLIPPSYMIYIPALDQSVHQYTDFHLSYVDAKNESVFPWSEAEGMDLQDMLLLLIYQKTGVLFTRHSGYVHNIIPTTIRGLNHLLHLLSNMEEVPVVESKADNFTSAEHLADAILQQVEVQDENLNRFADYFNGDWVKVKIVHAQDREFLGELVNKPGHLYVQYTIDYLYHRYKNSDIIKKHTEAREKYRTQAALDQLIMKLTEEHSKQEDYYLFFAIRTVFTLNHHKMILRQKRRAVKKFKAIKKNVPRFFVIDYDPEETGLTRTYPVNLEISRISLGKSKWGAEAAKQLSKGKRELSVAEKENAEFIANDRLLRREMIKAEYEATILERQRRSAENEANIAQRDLRDKTKNSEAANLDYELVLSEIPAHLVTFLDNGKPVDVAADTYKSYARAKAAKEFQEKAVLDAKGKFDAAKQDVEELQQKILDQQLVLHDLRVKAEQRTVDAQNKANTVQEAKDKFKSLESEIVANAEKLDPYCGKNYKLLHVRPVFKVVPWHKEELMRLDNPSEQDILFKKDNPTAQDEQNRNEKPILELRRFFRDCMVAPGEDGEDSVNFMNFITFILRLGYPNVVKQVQDDKTDPVQFQMQLYLTQECALTIAANWDVQDAIYKKLAPKSEETKTPYSEYRFKDWKEMRKAKGEWMNARAEQFTEKTQQGKLFTNLYSWVDHVLKSEVNNGRMYTYRKRWIKDNPYNVEWSIEKGFSMLENLKLSLNSSFFEDEIFGIEQLK